MFDPADYTPEAIMRKIMRELEDKIQALETANRGISAANRELHAKLEMQEETIHSLMQARKKQNVDALETRIVELKRDNSNLKFRKDVLEEEKERLLRIIRTRDDTIRAGVMTIGELQKFKDAYIENRKEIERRGNQINQLEHEKKTLELTLEVKEKERVKANRQFIEANNSLRMQIEAPPRAFIPHAELERLNGKLEKMEKNHERLQKFVHDKLNAELVRRINQVDDNTRAAFGKVDSKMQAVDNKIARVELEFELSRRRGH